MQLKIGYKSYAKLFIKMIYGMSAPTQTHLYVTQINSPIFNFYWNYRINHVFEIFEDRFEIEVLKIGSLKLKFEI